VNVYTEYFIFMLYAISPPFHRVAKTRSW